MKKLTYGAIFTLLLFLSGCWPYYGHNMEDHGHRMGGCGYEGDEHRHHDKDYHKTDDKNGDQQKAPTKK